MTAIIAYILANKLAIAAIASGVLNVASMIAALTPTQSDDNVIHRIQNLLATFFGSK